METVEALPIDVDTTDADTRNVVATLKLPPFWTINPEIWFHQAEAQFSISKVRADRLKYDHVIASLPLEVVLIISDVIENPPETNLYSNLKNKLIDRLTASEEQRLDKLLTGSEMGSRKPSVFFREMSFNVGGSAVVSQDLLLKLWKRRLPKTVSIALTASGQSKLDDVLTLADKVWEAYKENNISAVDASRPASSKPDYQTSRSVYGQNAPESEHMKFSNKIDELSATCKQTLDSMLNRTSNLETQIQLLREQMNSLQFSRYRPRRPFATSNDRSRSNSRSSSNRCATEANICFYHRKFKDQAQKCKGPWCKFLAQNTKN